MPITAVLIAGSIMLLWLAIGLADLLKNHEACKPKAAHKNDTKDQTNDPGTIHRNNH